MKELIASFFAFLNEEDRVIEELREIVNSETKSFNPPHFKRANQKKRRRRRGRK